MFDFVSLHEEFPVALSIGSKVDIQSLRVSHIQNLPIIGKLKSDDVLGVFFDDLGRFHLLHDCIREIDS